MKVVAFNGSPRRNGNTSQMLKIVLDILETEGIATESVRICGTNPHGCTACMQCAKKQNRQCVITADPVNNWIAKMIEADGIIFASPTYFANVSTEMKALIDRSGLVARVNNNLLRRKVGAAVVAVRRGGAVPVYDALMRSFQINEMIIPGSTYWNFGFGLKPGEVEDDKEGVNTMEKLGENMAWLLKKLN